MATTSGSPLNQSLYQRLVIFFGAVEIVNCGQPRMGRAEPDPSIPRGVRYVSHQRGEQYRLNCPFCGDRHKRLYVSYECGTYNNHLFRFNDALWCCHNETHCHMVPANRERFRLMIASPPGRQFTAAACSASVNFASTPTPTAPAPDFCWPAGLTPLVGLRANHEAVAYVLRRGFDLTELSNTWHVCIQRSSPSSTQKLFIPVYGVRPATGGGSFAIYLAGWQLRTLDPTAFGPKYLSATGMRKSELLYGLPQALGVAGPVLVVEGVTDCWAYGPGAVAVLGSSPSATQKAMLVRHFAGRPIVVMLDRDIDAGQLRRIAGEIRALRYESLGDSRVVVGRLPLGRNDPGECRRDELQLAVADALRTP